MNKPRLSVISTLVLAALSFSANADDPVIYDQYPKNYEPGKKEDRFLTGDYSDTVAGQTNDQIAADNFTLTTSDAIISGVSWWGGSDGGTNSSTDNFQSITIRILSNIDDPADSRSNIIYEETVPFSATINDSSWVGFGDAIDSGVVYHQYLTFRSPVELCKGSEYWISISATNQSPPIDNNGYFWYGAGAVVDNSTWTATFSNNPFEWDELFGDQGFELKGVNTTLGKVKCPTPTPEPGSVDYTTAPTPTATPIAETPIPAAVWLFGSGLAGLFAVARRRKSKS